MPFLVSPDPMVGCWRSEWTSTIQTRRVLFLSGHSRCISPEGTVSLPSYVSFSVNLVAVIGLNRERGIFNRASVLRKQTNSINLLSLLFNIY